MDTNQSRGPKGKILALRGIIRRVTPNIYETKHENSSHIANGPLVQWHWPHCSKAFVWKVHVPISSPTRCSVGKRSLVIVAGLQPEAHVGRVRTHD